MVIKFSKWQKLQISWSRKLNEIQVKKHEENDTKANHSQTAHTSDKEKILKAVRE